MPLWIQEIGNLLFRPFRRPVAAGPVSETETAEEIRNAVEADIKHVDPADLERRPEGAQASDTDAERTAQPDLRISPVEVGEGPA